MILDILAIGAHPDDVELGCGGTLLSHIDKGYKVGIVDLTKGELGTRGSAEIRLAESLEAARILGVSVRENLGFEDVFFLHDRAHLLEVIKILRHYRPQVVLVNAQYDRHPDHGKCAALLRDGVFLAGLPKISTSFKGELQQAHRPRAVYSYIQALNIIPDFVVDITKYFETKMRAVLAYKSQF
ncbi:MAG: bacillithiol biosynthesis deacetylase BshB1, partial [Chitinophagales bacterium]|nr:bacillithiol biosynthesis deacetylase BshB1 [Chitinophagales bacterium]MDW8273477.1 bacillithiol biosynthesis deacetylase BshB1 [Chitinophagales bacterium]